MNSDAQKFYIAKLVDAGCTIKYETFLFGKTYYWMVDDNNNWFLERTPN